jgi:hypothetical protein
MKAITAVLAVLVTCSGCSVTPAQPSPAPAPVTSSASPSSSPQATIPEGVSWTRTLTNADRKAFNVDVSTKEMEWAPDHTLVTILKFGGGAWTQFANYNGGPQQPGDDGTYSYDTAGNLVLTSPVGGTYQYSWHVAGDRLTLKMLGVPPRSSGDLAATRMMTEGVWERAAP